MTRRYRLADRRRRGPGLAAAAALLALAACTGDYVPGESFGPYVERALSMNLLRTHRSPPDAPVTPRELADNFATIAFRFEQNPLFRERPASPRSGGILRRWETPVIWKFAVTAAEFPSPKGRIARTMQTIAHVTGHSIRQAADGEKANFFVLFVDETSASVVREVSDEPVVANFVEQFGRAENAPCIGAFSHIRASGAAIRGAVVLIRHSLPPRLRAACIEEELAQSMGLPNDDPRVRPSIFNDDNEFAYLTRHDLALLRILYDSRLSAGMTEAEAMEIVPAIIDDIAREGWPAVRGLQSGL